MKGSAIMKLKKIFHAVKAKAKPKPDIDSSKVSV